MSEEAKEENPSKQDGIEEPPPFGKSWNSLYRIVLFTLAALILIFYIITTTLS